MSKYKKSPKRSTDLLLKPDDPAFDLKYVHHVVRAWKDPLYRQGLSEEELARLPDPPSGPIMNLVAEREPVQVPWWTIIIATLLLTCGLCHTAPETCGHGGCIKDPSSDDDGGTTGGPE